MPRLDNAYKLADSTDINGEELFVCPYDPNHKIRAKRFPYHIKACSRNHPFADVATCPFNARHIVRRPEMKYHLTNCPDKRVIEQDLELALQKERGDENRYTGRTDVPAYNSFIPPCAEDWDAEIAITRNLEYTRTEPFDQEIYRNTCGMTPAEKRAHKEYLMKQQERRKAGLPVEPENIDDDPVPDLVPSSGKGPLRLPREPAKAYQHVSQMNIARQNSRLGLIGLGRGEIMKKQVDMANQEMRTANSAIKAPEKDNTPPSQGFGRGMAANFGSASTISNGSTSITEAQTFVRMVGRGRGGTPQMRNRKPTPQVGGLTDNQQNGWSTLQQQTEQQQQQQQQTQQQQTQQQPTQQQQIQQEKLEEKSAEVDESSSQEESEDVTRKKLLRKLNKKLNGIHILEKRKESGQKLSEEEEQKILKRAATEQQIAVLSQLEP